MGGRRVRRGGGAGGNDAWRSNIALAYTFPLDPPPLTCDETFFQVKLEALLDRFGWIWHHSEEEDRNNRGFPDLEALHPSWSVAYHIELKTERGPMKPEQRTVLDAYTAAGHLCLLVRPRHWPLLVRLAQFGRLGEEEGLCTLRYDPAREAGQRAASVTNATRAAIVGKLSDDEALRRFLRPRAVRTVTAATRAAPVLAQQPTTLRRAVGQRNTKPATLATRRVV